MSAVLALTVVSCKTVNSTAPTLEQTNDQENTIIMNNLLKGTWTLSSINKSISEGKTIKELFPNKIPFLNFDTEKTTVNGTDGCNNIFGKYEVSGPSSIKIGDKLASTLMACEGVSDYLFMSNLANVTTFEVKGNELILSSDEGYIYKFTKQSNDKLDGSEWVLDFIQPLDRSLKSLEDRFPFTVPTIKFEGNKVFGNAGCNNFNGALETSNGTLNIDKLAMTRKFCEGVEENLYTSNLQNAKKYKIQDGELTLLSADDLVLLRFKKK